MQIVTPPDGPFYAFYLIISHRYDCSTTYSTIYWWAVKLFIAFCLYKLFVYIYSYLFMLLLHRADSQKGHSWSIFSRDIKLSCKNLTTHNSPAINEIADLHMLSPALIFFSLRGKNYFLSPFEIQYLFMSIGLFQLLLLLSFSIQFTL